MSIADFLNDREKATSLWLAAVFLFALSVPAVRSSLKSVCKATLNWKILVSFLFFFAYVSASVAIAQRIGLWNRDLLKDTFLWTILSGVPLFVRLMTKRDFENFTRNVLKDILAISVVLVFFLNLRPLGLIWELALQPLIVVCAASSVVAARSSKTLSAKKLFDGCLVGIVSALLIFTAIGLMRDYPKIDGADLIRALALEFWLPVAVIPFIYLCALVAQYELAFMRMRFAIGKKPISWRRKVGVVFGYRFDLQSVAKLYGGRAAQIANAPSVGEQLRAIQSHKRDLVKAREDELVAAAGLERFEGVQGTNPDGTQLDQREFDGTKEALQWIATCQMGWYRNRGHYVPNILKIVGDLSRHGLEGNSRVFHHLSDDGQSWWAWRRTVTGWVFAIGASGPPPNQWLYDGPNPPSGPPGSDPVWGKHPFVSAGPNW